MWMILSVVEHYKTCDQLVGVAADAREGGGKHAAVDADTERAGGCIVSRG